MPTYGYKCRKCNEEFDVFQKMSDSPVEKCPKCGGPVKRVFHPVGIIFKGSGFYSTDNKRQPSKPASTETAKTDSTPQQGDESKKQDSAQKNKTTEAAVKKG